MTRRPLIAGNWKMHTITVEAVGLACRVAHAARGYADRDVLLAPPFTVLAAVASELIGTEILLAGQNVHWEVSGAFTGEVSPAMLRDVGAGYAIVGHSERRHLFGEDDAMVNRRTVGALAHGLIPILCIGETLEQREQGETMAVLTDQVKKGLAGVTLADPHALVLAYEPVWAIGTGRTATSAQAQEVHAGLRSLFVDLFEKQVAEGVRILYGGSVKPDNIDELMSCQDIDGVLVGGAALSAESFGRILQFRQNG